MKTERFPIHADARRRRTRGRTMITGASYSYLRLRGVLRALDERAARPVGFGLASPVLPAHRQAQALALGAIPAVGPVLAAVLYAPRTSDTRVALLTTTRLHLLPVADDPVSIIEGAESLALHEIEVSMRPPRGWEGWGDPGRRTVFLVRPAGGRSRDERVFTIAHRHSPAAAALREGLAALADHPLPPDPRIPPARRPGGGRLPLEDPKTGETP